MYKLFVAIVLLCGAQGLFAQNNGNPLAGQDSMILENERVVDILNSDKPTISLPVRTINTPDMEEITYNSQKFYYPIKLELPLFQPKAFQPNSRQKGDSLPIYNNLLKVGLGQYLTPVVNLYMANGKDAEVNYALDFAHKSVHADRLKLRQFREDGGTLMIGKSKDDRAFSVRLHGYNTAYSQYATFVTPKEPYTAFKDSLKRGFTQADITLNMQQAASKKAPLSYDISLGSRNIIGENPVGIAKGNRETQIFLDPNVGFLLNDNFSLGLLSQINYTNAALTLDSTIKGANNRFFVKGEPTLLFKKDDVFSAKAGLIAGFFSDAFEGNKYSRGNIAPVAEVFVGIIPSRLSITAGYRGNLTNNTYYSILEQCRFVNPNMEIRPTFEKGNAFVSVDGNINYKMDINVKGYYRTVKNQLMFVAVDSSDIRVRYDDMNVIGGAVNMNYNVSQSLMAGLSVAYNHYKTTQEKAYFGAPPLTIRLHANWGLLDNKLNIKPVFFIYGKTPVALSASDAVINRNFMTDLALHADYKLSERFFAFADFNNLAFNNYFRYYLFPERRVNFSAGIGIIF